MEYAHLLEGNLSPLPRLVMKGNLLFEPGSPPMPKATGAVLHSRFLRRVWINPWTPTLHPPTAIACGGGRGFGDGAGKEGTSLGPAREGSNGRNLVFRPLDHPRGGELDEPQAHHKIQRGHGRPAFVAKATSAEEGKPVKLHRKPQGVLISPCGSA